MGEGSKRNDLCHCGSGKKYKRCCQTGDESVKQFGFTFEVTDEQQVTGMKLGPRGEIIPMAGDRPLEMKNVRITEWRDTARGPKIRSQVSPGDGIPFINPDAYVAANSDFIFGVDTNSILTHGRKISVSCLTCATTAFQVEGFAGTIQQIQCVDFEDDEYPAERIGWLLACESIVRSRPPVGSRITLCTDHDVDAHAAINERREPLVPGYFLPDGCRLAYAGDKGSTIANKVVKAAHKGASSVMKSVTSPTHLSQRVLPFLYKSPGAPTEIRRWKNAHNERHYFGGPKLLPGGS